MRTFNILCIGDIIGGPGVEFIKKNLWRLRKENDIQCVVANGENSAKGNGIDINAANTIFESGADVITTGNHVWQKREIYNFLDENSYIIRPANYPDSCPGAGYSITDILGYKILFINLLGSLFMDTPADSPFAAADRIFHREKGGFDFAVVDIHAEATSEKIALAKYIDGKYKAGLIFGTHTHIQTADEQILKNGAGYITDLGMTGGFDSILGIKNELIIQKFLTKMPVKFEVCDENIELCGIIAKIDTDSGNFKCADIKRVKFTD